jgi:hypothetical protein
MHKAVLTMKSTTEKRDPGMALTGELGWTSHFRQFYEAKKDLLDILFREVLRNEGKR